VLLLEKRLEELVTNGSRPPSMSELVAAQREPRA